MPARRFALALVLALGVLALSTRAAAQQPEPSADPAGVRARELTALESELAAGDQAIVASDCVAACTALASMRRAAERLCALDPGARCTAARARVEDAARRVHEHCPSCEAAGPERPTVQQPTSGVAPKPSPDPMSNTPPEAGGRGGCRGCALGAGDAGAWFFAAAALGLGALVRRRRTRSGRAR